MPGWSEGHSCSHSCPHCITPCKPAEPLPDTLLQRADFFSADRLFYSNSTNQWLGAPNAALFGLRNNRGKNNTVLGLILAEQMPFHSACITLHANLSSW